MTTAALDRADVQIVRLEQLRLSELMDVQKIVCDHLPTPELYFPVSEPEMLELLGPDAICFGAQHDGQLVGFFGVLFMGDRPGNVGEDLGLAAQELPLVAYFKAVNVLPDYRGIGLQERMTKALFAEMGVGGSSATDVDSAHPTPKAPGVPPFKWLCSTVSPLNVSSLKIFLDHGFWVAGLKPKYLGYQRCLLLRPRWDTKPKNEGGVVVSLQDYPGQTKLLKSGMVGSLLDCIPHTPKIHYIQSNRQPYE